MQFQKMGKKSITVTVQTFLCFFLLLVNTITYAQFQKSGIVKYSVKIWDSASNSFIRFPTENTPDIVVYYKDSSAIQVKHRWYTKHVNGKLVENRWLLEHYKFIDLPTRQFYEYPALHKDTMFTQKYIVPDSTLFVGFNFYNKKAIPVCNNNAITHPDTIINGIAYKHMSSSCTKEFNNKQYDEFFDIYSQCDKKGTIFHIGKLFEEEQQLECPITMLEIYETSSGIRMRFEIKYLDRKLTRKELRIFKAWQKNAKKYPVTGK